MPLPLVVGVVVFLLALAAMCGAIAIWTILHDLRAARRVPTAAAVPALQAAAPAVPTTVTVRPPRLPAPQLPGRRLPVPPGVPLLPPLLARRAVLATPLPFGDDDPEDDYTEVDDGVTMIRHARLAARR